MPISFPFPCPHGFKAFATKKNLNIHLEHWCKRIPLEEGTFALVKGDWDAPPLPSPPSPSPPAQDELPYALPLPGTDATVDLTLAPTSRGRAQRLPRRLMDMVPTLRSSLFQLPDALRCSPTPPAPEGPPHSPSLSHQVEADTANSVDAHTELCNIAPSMESTPLDQEVVTDPNEFGIWRVYPHQPSHDPDQHGATAYELWESSGPDVVTAGHNERGVRGTVVDIPASRHS
jgi:hypothetical protein